MKGREDETRTFPFPVGVITMIIGLVASLLVNTLWRDWIVISFGIRIFKVVRWFSFIIVAGEVIATIHFCILRLRTRILLQRTQEKEFERQQQRSKVLTDYAEDSTNPDFTRKRFQQLQSEIPELSALIDECLAQMDRMDKLQTKQQILIDTNEALYLRETVIVLDNVERRLCRNFRNIINLCVAAEDYTGLDQKKVQKNLDDNEKKLHDAKKLLKASVDWINQYNMDSENSDRSEVENWIAVIRNSLKEDE